MKLYDSLRKNGRTLSYECDALPAELRRPIYAKHMPLFRATHDERIGELYGGRRSRYRPLWDRVRRYFISRKINFSA